MIGVRDRMSVVSRRLVCLGALLVCLLVFTVLPGVHGTTALAAAAEADPDPAALEIQPGNYCTSCHLPEDARLEGASGWAGGIEQAQTSPCPAALRIQEELLYTEQLLLAADRLRESLPDSPAAERIDAQLNAGREGYSRLLDMPLHSLGAFTAEAQTLRFQIAKSYAALNSLLDGQKKLALLVGAALVTLALVISFVMGLRLTRKAVAGSVRRPVRGYLAPAALVVAVFAFFALPIFRVPAAVTETPSLEEQAVQTELDEAGRAAEAANRASGRAWMLARVGAAWQESGLQSSAPPLAEALEAASELRLNTGALWGQAQAAQEISAGVAINEEKSLITAARLQAERNRAWSLALIANEWIELDPARAATILEEALRTAEGAEGIYRDLDLRLIAVYWSKFDPQQAVAVVNRVRDHGVRSWGLREIATTSGDAALYREAAEAAVKVWDPLARARLLREIDAAAEDESLFEAALEALQEVPDGAGLAFELAELAGASGHADLLEGVVADYPQALALGFFRLEQYEQAWEAAGKILNPYERGKAQAAIAAAWGSSDQAYTIENTVYRDRALLALVRQDAALAADLTLPYYRVQAFTALGDLETAWTVSELVQDAYPLVGLAQVLAVSDPGRALEVMERMDREAEKAEALWAIAAATGDEALFERALGMALAARVRGDALNPVEASLKLALTFAEQEPDWAEAAFLQAYEAAERISVK